MVGQTVSHYRILERLGGGGMGVVYKAEDTKLGRTIALKVLPPERVADPSRKRRFIQEARAASALNHPNIITIYDIDEADGVHFIAMEYVEGKTLDRLIARHGLRLNEALKYAVQMAAALAKAHSAGIVHRDLKPANVMVTDDGLVKVLDFGLAKLTEAAPTGEAETVATVGPATEEGTIVGTVGYMSPEQAEGKPVDARSDIFSFGSVLYEMLTGQRAFQGETKASTIAAILREEPKPLSQVAQGLPHEVERLVKRCLRKDPAHRVQHMDDLKVALEELKEESDSGELAQAPDVGAVPRPHEGRALAYPRWVVLGAMVSAAIVLLGAAGYVLMRLAAPIKPAQPPAVTATFTQLSDQPGPELFPSLSPDGKTVVYAKDGDIYSLRVGGKNPVNLTKDSAGGNTQPAFSPDGELIAFRSEREGSGIFVMGATGESARRLTNFGYNPAWSPDGTELVFASEYIERPTDRGTISKLWVVNVSTGVSRVLFQGDGVQPQWSPHGYRIAYWAVSEGSQRDIWTLPAGGGEPVQVTNDPPVDWNPIWSPDGNYIYFSSDRGGTMNLWRVPIAEKTGKVLGPPEPITTPSTDASHMSFSHDGRRMAYAQRTASSNIYKVEFDPAKGKVVGESTPITQGTRNAIQPCPSPDGQWLAFASGGAQSEIFVVRTDGTGLRQLSDGRYRNRAPCWSPDGKKIAFYSSRSGKLEVWTVNGDGSGFQQLTYEGRGSVWFPVWSPDGGRLAYYVRYEPAREVPGDSFIMDVTTPWKDQPHEALPRLRNPDAGFESWSWSADGTKLAGTAIGGGVWSGIGVYSVDSRKCEWLLDYGSRPVWLRDSRRLLFFYQGKIHLLDSSAKKVSELLPADSEFQLSRDNRAIYFSRSSVEADIWLATLQ
jgi:Tol biopolymer transport system component/predicted Ser/Thr protein kinase